MLRARTEERRAELKAELKAMALPLPGAYLWNVYGRLRRRKGGNGFGAMPIEWVDIQAFMASAQYPLSPWEIEVIEDIDDAFMTESAKAADTPPPEPSKP